MGLRRLERAGLAERLPDPRDRRAVRFFLTPKGKRLYGKALRFRWHTARPLLAGLMPQEREMLLDLLDKAIRGAEVEIGRRRDEGKRAFSGGIDDAQTSGLQSRGSKHTRFLLRLWACIAACPRDGALGQRRET